MTAPLEPKPDVTSTEQVTELKRKHETVLAKLMAQLEDKEADLAGSPPPVALCRAIQHSGSLWVSLAFTFVRNSPSAET